jgi:HK97 family phage portal protein
MKRSLTFTDAIQKWLSDSYDDLPTGTSSGVNVTPANSISLSTVYACVKILSETIASLPLPVYKDLSPKGREQAKSHFLYKILHDQPNPYQTSFAWRALTITHLCLWGAGISEIEFDKNGYPVALWPLPPWRVEPKRDGSGNIFYKVRLDGSGQDFKYLRYDQVLVFPALSTSSFEWMSPIRVQRETIGAAMAVKEFGAKTFGQGTNPAAIVTYQGRMNETSEKSLEDKMQKYSGLGESHRLMLLGNGMEFKRIGLPPEDAQFLETQKFSVSEISRIFNVPLFMLNEHEKQTSWGSGIEEQKNGFVTFSLTPVLVKMEQEMKVKLVFGIADDYYPEFNLQGLLRGNLKDRVAAYKDLWMLGSMSANEIRDKENMNPIENGDKYYIPMNISEVGKIAQKPANNGNEDKNDEDIDDND